MPLSFMRRLLGDKVAPSMLQLFTPNVVSADRPATRIIVAGVTIIGIAVAGAVALGSFMALLGALFGMYLLLTQVLGLELEMDPRAFVAEAQKYAAQARSN